ncbi:hypothetical protein GCM10023340_10900 [Nocardioides marinquilinus]|uniref:Uncharacterized protein n=1 Tax=Nocardioides marinquilinus TaxID=1210400 RepID=A0ABP9PF90_9ACTN
MPSLTTRGLATSAVAALAVTGLALAPAPATSAAGPGVALLSQAGASPVASVRWDGRDDTVRLALQTADPTAVVGWDYNLDPQAANGASGWTEITATSGTMTGYAVTDWDPTATPDGDLVGRTVALRARATTTGGTSFARRTGVRVVGGEQTRSLFAESEGGFFRQPYADSDRTGRLLVVSGTTGANAGNVVLEAWRAEDGEYAWRTNAQVEASPIKGPEGSVAFGGEFDGVLDLRAFDAAVGDTLAVRAELDSDHVEPITLYRQTITQASASTNGPKPAGEATEVTFFVDDQNGFGIAGAEVRRRSNGNVVGYTDGTGQVATTQPAGTTQTYYVNTTDVDAFEDGVDPVVEVEAAAYTPEPTSAGPVSFDLDAFDLDEYAVGDLAVGSYDQQGQPIGRQPVEYRLYQQGETPPETWTPATTAADGYAPVQWQPAAGQWVLEARMAGTSGVSSLGFQAGQARLVLTPGPAAGPGGRQSFTGRLTLGDGVDLPFRKVDLAFQRGVEVVPGRDPDAGILVGGKRLLTSSVTTDDDGAFSFVVADEQQTPRAAETGGRLLVATGETVADSDWPPVDGDADAGARRTVGFGSGRGTASIGLAGRDNGPAADVLRVTGASSLAGERVKVLRVLSGGRFQQVAQRTLDGQGDVDRLVVADRNAGAKTGYVVRLLGSTRVQAAVSKVRRVR